MKKNSFGANTSSEVSGRGPGRGGAARSVQAGAGVMATKVTPHVAGTRAVPSGKSLRTKPYDRNG